ncbi:hypothetical protein ADK49_03535, partial [Streptomyces sp. WM6349]
MVCPVRTRAAGGSEAAATAHAAPGAAAAEGARAAAPAAAETAEAPTALPPHNPLAAPFEQWGRTRLAEPAPIADAARDLGV